MESPSGKPACVFEDTAKKLENRGWEIIQIESIKSLDVDSNVLDNFESEIITIQSSPILELHKVGELGTDQAYPDLESTEETVEEFVTLLPNPQINEKPIFRVAHKMIGPEYFGAYVPKTNYIQHAFTLSDWNRDELAKKLTDFTNDKIINQHQTPNNHTNYETVKGTLIIGANAWGNSFAEYNLVGQHIIRPNLLKDFTLNLQQELNFPTDNEVLSELNRQHFDMYKYAQKIDDLYIKETGMIVSTDSVYTRIYIKNWFTVTDVELYDYEQAKQIAKDYALMFDELTGPECKITATDNFWYSVEQIISN